jgi:hypothetical protein
MVFATPGVRVKGDTGEVVTPLGRPLICADIAVPVKPFDAVAVKVMDWLELATRSMVPAEVVRL